MISFDVDRKNNYKWFNEGLIYNSLSQKRPKQSIYHEGVIYLWSKPVRCHVFRCLIKVHGGKITPKK